MKVIAQLALVLLLLFLVTVVLVKVYESWERIQKVEEPDWRHPFRAIWQISADWIGVPIRAIENLVQEREPLRISLTPLSGYTFDLGAGQSIPEGFMRDRQQYRLEVRNAGSRTLSDIRLRFQIPYPIEQDKLEDVDRSSPTSFKPSAALTEGGGSLQITGRPLSSSWELVLANMKGSGRISMLVLLNSWRDPRGKEIPKEDAQRYFIPEVSPELTYVYGTYSVEHGSGTEQREFYAPFSLDESKIVSIGKPTTPVPNLMQTLDMQMSP